MDAWTVHTRLLFPQTPLAHLSEPLSSCFCDVPSSVLANLSLYPVPNSVPSWNKGINRVT